MFLPVFTILYVQRAVENRNVPLFKRPAPRYHCPHIYFPHISTNIWLSLLIDPSHRQTTITYTFLMSLLFSGNLMIEKIRFEDKLEVSIEMDEAVKRTMVPKFILQPLVENALSTGLRTKTKQG